MGREAEVAQVVAAVLLHPRMTMRHPHLPMTMGEVLAAQAAVQEGARAAPVQALALAVRQGAAERGLGLPAGSCRAPCWTTIMCTGWGPRSHAYTTGTTDET
jgi:hypothetical protein